MLEDSSQNIPQLDDADEIYNIIDPEIATKVLSESNIENNSLEVDQNELMRAIHILETRKQGA